MARIWSIHLGAELSISGNSCHTMGPGCLPCLDDCAVQGLAVPDEVGQQPSRVTPTSFTACYEHVLINVLIKIKDTKSLIFPKGSSRGPNVGQTPILKRCLVQISVEDVLNGYAFKISSQDI